MPSTFNRRLKKWPGWVALAFVVVAFLAVGVARTSGPTESYASDRRAALS